MEIKVIPMNENKLRWIIYFLIIAGLCVSVYIVSSAHNVLSDALFNIYGWTVLNAIVLVIAYTVSQKLRILAFWKFAVYLAAATAGSICINYLLTEVDKWIYFSPQVRMVVFVIGGFIVLAFFNFILSRTIFSMKMRNAIIFGVIMGLITMINSGPYCR
jgi:hypothetical protein